MSNKITSLVTSYLDYKRGLGFQMTAESVYLNAHIAIRTLLLLAISTISLSRKLFR